VRLLVIAGKRHVSCVTTVGAMKGILSKPNKKAPQTPDTRIPIDGNSPQSRAKTCLSELLRNSHTIDNSKSLLMPKLN